MCSVQIRADVYKDKKVPRAHMASSSRGPFSRAANFDDGTQGIVFVRKM